MIEINKLLEEYSFIGYSLYSKTITENEWGNRDIALKYLTKYFISEQEYLIKWKNILNKIFTNQEIGLPEIVFKKKYNIIVNRGGVLFIKDEFEFLKQCIKEIGDNYIVIIQNTFGKESKIPPFRMKYPIDVSWEELNNGNFISTVLIETYTNEYFVFSESGAWGKYSANDYEYPLDIIGFTQEYSHIFQKYFKPNNEELNEIWEWLPEKYRIILNKMNL